MHHDTSRKPRLFIDETQRHALANVVNGISDIEVTKAWGKGKTSGSDGQRFGYHKKTLHRTFSHKWIQLLTSGIGWHSFMPPLKQAMSQPQPRSSG